MGLRVHFYFGCAQLRLFIKRPSTTYLFWILFLSQGKDAMIEPMFSLFLFSFFQGAFGLIAYQDPYTSPFRRFLDPSHRDRLADAVNSAIMGEL